MTEYKSEHVSIDILPIHPMSKEICYFCKKIIDAGVSFSNLQKYNDEICFVNMPLGETAHMECYIDYSVEQKFMKLFNLRRNKND